MILDSVTEKITLVLAGATTTSPGDCDAAWTTSDPAAILPTPTFGAGSNSPQTNGTTSVDLVPVPTTSTMRVSVQSLSVVNADTAPMTVTIRKTDGGTNRRVFGPVSILPNEKIQFTREEGWRVFDATGAIRTSSALSTVTGLKNQIINGSFRVNQRVFAGGALAAGVYGYDRWKAGAGGCNVTVNPTTFVVTHTSGPHVQVIETPSLAGQIVTVSVSDPSGSISVDVDGQTGTITAGAGRRGATVTVPIGSTGNVTLTMTATGVTYSDVQMERGPFATTFELLPIGVVNELCKRYYEKSYDGSVAPGTAGVPGGCVVWVNPNTAGNIRQPVTFAVGKRATPAITPYSFQTGAAGQAYNNSAAADAAASPGFIGTSAFNLSVPNPGSLAEWRAHWAANAEL